MLFHVATTVDLRRELGETTAEALKAKERERAAELQGQGKWRHRWRVAGRYANVAIFDVEDAKQLHALLISLSPLPLHANRGDGALPRCLLDPGWRHLTAESLKQGD